MGKRAGKVVKWKEFLVLSLGSSLYLVSIDSSSAEKIHSSSSTTPNDVIDVCVADNVLLWIAEDKKVRCMDLDSRAVVWTRDIIKKGSAIWANRSSSTVFVGDKFGDLYSFPIASPAPQDPASMQKPVLGHVSMMTAGLAVESDGVEYVVTADRDEHIRVSKLPEGYIIHSFCLGHTSYISSLTLLSLPPSSASSASGSDTGPGRRVLVSGGGDAWLGVWDWFHGRLLSRINLTSIKSRLPQQTPFAVLKVTEITGLEGCLAVLVEGVNALFLYTAVTHGEVNEPELVVEMESDGLDFTVCPADAQEEKVIYVTTAAGGALLDAHTISRSSNGTYTSSRRPLTLDLSAGKEEVEEEQGDGQSARNGARVSMMRKRTKEELDLLRSSSTKYKS